MRILFSQLYSCIIFRYLIKNTYHFYRKVTIKKDIFSRKSFDNFFFNHFIMKIFFSQFFLFIIFLYVHYILLFQFLFNSNVPQQSKTSNFPCNFRLIINRRHFCSSTIYSFQLKFCFLSKLSIRKFNEFLRLFFSKMATGRTIR